VTQTTLLAILILTKYRGKYIHTVHFSVLPFPSQSLFQASGRRLQQPARPMLLETRKKGKQKTTQKSEDIKFRRGSLIVA